MRVSPDRLEELTFDIAAEILNELPPELRAEAEDVMPEIEFRPSHEQLASARLEPDATCWVCSPG